MPWLRSVCGEHDDGVQLAPRGSGRCGRRGFAANVCRHDAPSASAWTDLSHGAVRLRLPRYTSRDPRRSRGPDATARPSTRGSTSRRQVPCRTTRLSIHTGGARASWTQPSWGTVQLNSDGSCSASGELSQPALAAASGPIRSSTHPRVPYSGVCSPPTAVTITPSACRATPGLCSPSGPSETPPARW